VGTATERSLPDAGTDSTEPSLIEIAFRRWWLIGLCVLLGAVAAGVYSAKQEKLYTASADVLFRADSPPEQSVQTVLGLPSPSISPDPTQEAATDVALVSLGTVADMTAQALRHGVSAGEVASEVSVGEVGQSNIVTLTATDSSPVRAAALANEYARQIVVFRQNLNRSVVASAILDVQNRLRKLPPGQTSGPGPTRTTLRSQLSQLSALAGSQTGDVQVVQTASIPSAPSSPRTKLNIAAGAVLGLILGIALALLVHRLDRRVESPTELGDAYGLPVLGVVPRTRQLALANRGVAQRLRLANAARPPNTNGTRSTTHLVLPASAADAFRAVRTRLRYAHPDRDIRSVLVTSASRGEGKSTVAWQLARVVAMQRNRRVLVLECDLRRPILARAHGLSPAPGLVEVLSGSVPLNAAVQTLDPSTEEAHFDFVSLDDLSLDSIGQLEPEGKSSPGGVQRSQMDVLVAGSPTSSPADLLDSDQMSALLQDLASQYDFILLDAPPGPLVSDTFPLVSQADGVIIVSSMRHASRDAVNTLRSQLELLDAPILGVVVNNAKHGGEADYPYVYQRAEANGTATMTPAGTSRTDEFRDDPPEGPSS
jgi:polysaccharide biosynthesis transport protein